MTPAVEVQRLVKRWRDLLGRPRVALDGLDLVVADGEGVALVGPNGAGKSTLLLVIAGLRRPTGGEIRIHGLRPNDPKARRDLGLLPERPALPGSLAVREVLALHADVAGLPADRVDAAIARLGLGDWAEARVDTLSAGVRHRLALAVALMARPSLLLLDEPLANLDPGSIRQIVGVLAEERARGVTLLVATHRLAELGHLCSRVVRIADGRAEDLGAPAALLASLPTRLLVRTGAGGPLSSEIVDAAHRDARIAAIVAAGGSVVRVEPLIDGLTDGRSPETRS